MFAGILSKSDICKSSLIDAFYKICELTAGKIYIDSVDTSQIDIQHLRKQISLIPKNPIFYGTIR
jgi:ABC-type multidrug transport system fused ATPase/permease subunit